MPQVPTRGRRDGSAEAFKLQVPSTRPRCPCTVCVWSKYFRSVVAPQVSEALCLQCVLAKSMCSKSDVLNRPCVSQWQLFGASLAPRQSGPTPIRHHARRCWCRMNPPPRCGSVLAATLHGLFGAQTVRAGPDWAPRQEMLVPNRPPPGCRRGPLFGPPSVAPDSLGSNLVDSKTLGAKLEGGLSPCYTIFYVAANTVLELSASWDHAVAAWGAKMKPRQLPWATRGFQGWEAKMGS